MGDKMSSCEDHKNHVADEQNNGGSLRKSVASDFSLTDRLLLRPCCNETRFTRAAER
jgi:hypothetical protein